MIVKNYNTNLYKGSDFILKLRFKCAGSYVDLTGYTIYFNVSDAPSGTNLFSFSSADSPATITIDEDDNYLITISIDASDTSNIVDSKLYYEIDWLTPSGIRERKLVGNINVYGDAS